MSEQSENAQHRAGDYEYPDEAGYPDGTGTLDEGTAGVPDSARRHEDDEGV